MHPLSVITSYVITYGPILLEILFSFVTLIIIIKMLTNKSNKKYKIALFWGLVLNAMLPIIINILPFDRYYSFYFRESIYKLGKHYINSPDIAYVITLILITGFYIGIGASFYLINKKVDN